MGQVSVLIRSSHAVSFEVDAVCVLDDPVEDGVGDGLEGGLEISSSIGCES